MVLDDYDGQMIPGDECSLHFLIFVVLLRTTPEKPQPANWPDRDRVSNPGPLGERPLDQSDGVCKH